MMFSSFQDELYLRPAWYAAYTASRTERRVARQLISYGVENYLPLMREVHRWNRRDAEVDVPLFPGYVFVRFAMKDCATVTRIPGVVYLVGFPLAVPIPEEEIEALRLGLAERTDAAPCAYFSQGAKVRVRRGPLEGLVGVVDRRKEKTRVVISLHLLQRSVAVEVDETDLEEA